jgi:hypothetical protein
MIDWSKLKPYQGFNWKSFEELCYQIAEGLYCDKGRFSRIDDSGGDGGVEFYLTMPDGIEWGWQAKFYYPFQRLAGSGRKASIKKSLERALRNHERLEKWFLCTPTNLTSGEKEWFDKLQLKYPSVVLEHWGDSAFNDFLRNPRFLGIKNHFFGELELSPDWFRRQVNKHIRNVRNKFIPNLHTETRVDFCIHTLLGDSVFKQYLKGQTESLEGHMSEFDKAVEELRDTDSRIEWQDVRNKLMTYSGQLREIFVEVARALTDTNDYLSSGRFEQIKLIDWDSTERELKKRLDDYSRTVSDFEPEKLPYKSKEEEQEIVSHYIGQKGRAPLHIANEVAGLLYEIKNNIERTGLRDLHIFGGAGIGKTHIACHMCQDRIASSLPAILLLGQHFTGSVPLKQILQILDIPGSYSWEDFVKTLQSAAEAYKTKIPIVIDALNEAQTVDMWKRELPGFAYALSSLPQVILVTTCRSNYRSEIWQQSEPKNTIETYGFEPDSLENAISKYFDWYKIKCDLTLAPLNQFYHPIFLKIFCESQNRERRVEKQIYLGEQTLLKVFEDYITVSNEAICSKLSKHPSTHVVQEALKNLAKELWKRKSRYVSLSDAVKLIDLTDIRNLDWRNSITCAILDEGLLINRDLINGQDAALFAYDLLGGYMIAKEIMSALTAEAIGDYVKSPEFKRYLLSDDFSERHHLHEDILRCFSLLLPMRFGKHLYQLTDDKTAFNFSVHALFEMAPELIDSSSKELIVGLFSRPENRKPLLKLAKTTVTHVGHPLNMEFWDKLLLELPMSERDLSWTELIRRDSSMFFSDLDKFESACKESINLTGISEQRLLLAASFFRWLLTSTVRPLRDTATRALYWYGRRFPNKFYDLVLSSLSINDPYVPERTLAAAYGIAMALQYDFQKSEFREEILPKSARNLYESMFKPDAPHATTHILSRDYAWRLIDAALIHNPDILASAEKQRITLPFRDGGIRNWGESEERDEDKYREGSMPIHMDFGNYTLGSLVPNRSNYDFNHEGYKKVRANIIWRLYDLGYSHDLFKEIDKEIYRYNWRFGRGADGDKIDRYGKKYSWIAFYELAGFLQDNGLLPEDYSNVSAPRTPHVDIDPSFPDRARECEVIRTDYLGDRSIGLSEWIENGDEADLSAYLIVEKLCNEIGPWVLLDGYINQEDLEAKRSRFIFPRGLLVRKDETSKLVERLENQNLGGRWLPDIPEDYYIYAGEIPWCETFPHNGTNRLEFVVDNDTHTSYEALVPVRYYNWESYHSSVNKAGSAMVPAKEVAEALDLCSQPQTFDLYEKNGRLASITLRWGESWHTEHHLTYLRQDLLEHYLKENNAELVWAIWGEKNFRSESIEEMRVFSEQHRAYRVFQTIKTYTETKESTAT